MSCKQLSPLLCGVVTWWGPSGWISAGCPGGLCFQNELCGQGQSMGLFLSSAEEALKGTTGAK